MSLLKNLLPLVKGSIFNLYSHNKKKQQASFAELHNWQKLLHCVQ